MRMSDEEYFRSCVARERELAYLLGHRNIEECYESAGVLWENTLALPQWTRDWNACAPLMVNYDITVNYGKESGDEHSTFITIGSQLVHISDHPTKDRAVMYAIVKAVIHMLEHGRAEKTA